MKKIHLITLSLAGICQSAHLVQQLAHSGKCDNNAFSICLKSILEINPASVIAIYGNHEKNLIVGLKILVSLLTFSSFSHSYFELIKYIFNMIIIERKLKKNRIAIYSLKYKISVIANEYHLNYNIENLINKLARLYLNIISSLGSRILVKGVKNFLQDLRIQEKIRCLLFSGIRAIVLWKQYGGNQLQLIYFRYSIIKKAKKILYNLKYVT
ncbi:lysogenization regulator [Buchnera aphidicola str. Ak (Acyrthosiphon kondoi)]|uniref:High frequency lysogenization protein HflD homolog n=1 Tax=Buchnera aphidicola str. Ak (Acyrthosiphon kondoi) TaxID=1005090 RepID=G2LMX7_9GAMM|nr:high frequency lysogenization protein HflD [Buchnera aphidicola]AEO08615.1 lysogenization regulator [Buchnera aphidicola str. Ak (Acyrthosiphon kondoi)]